MTGRPARNSSRAVAARPTMDTMPSGLDSPLPSTFTYTEPEQVTAPFSRCSPESLSFTPFSTLGMLYFLVPALAYLTLDPFQLSMVTSPSGSPSLISPEMLRRGPAWPGANPCWPPVHETVSACGMVMTSLGWWLAELSFCPLPCHAPVPTQAPGGVTTS